MENFVNPLLGGVLIGLAATGLMLLNGRVAGISGITNRIFLLKFGDLGWRLSFVFGLIFAGILFKYFDFPFDFKTPTELSTFLIVIGAVLVGAGSTLANGCTSGHGICGLSRLSKRSLVAVISFMTAGILTVYLMRLFGVMT